MDATAAASPKSAVFVYPDTIDRPKIARSKKLGLARACLRAAIVQSAEGVHDLHQRPGCAMRTCRYLVYLLFFVLAGLPSAKVGFGTVARAAGESPRDVLAAQIRTQGVVCDKPQRAVRDAKRSRPDHDVWVLTCENATYRVSRYPDLAAKIERLQ